MAYVRPLPVRLLLKLQQVQLLPQQVQLLDATIDYFLKLDRLLQ
jgi:hypothetical protein